MTSKITVLHLVQGLEIGGLELMTVSLLEGLDRSRFMPQVCCFDVVGPLADRLIEQGIPVHFLQRSPGVDLSYPFKLARLMRKEAIDILHLHNPTALFYGALAGKIARISRIIYTEHGRDFSSSWKVKQVNRFLSNIVDEIVVVAEYGRNYLVSKEKFSPSRIRKIYNGIDPKKFPSKIKIQVKQEILHNLGLTACTEIVGIVARLDPIKNHAALFKAMIKVFSVFPQAILLVIGDGPLRIELKEQVNELGLKKNIVFLGARLDIPSLLSALDVFVLPSLSEGLSLTLLEACAAGKPVVTTTVGGNPEIVENGVNGLLVPSADTEALGAAIVNILMNKEKAQQMGAKARAKFEELFTVETMINSYESLYEGCRRNEMSSC